MSDHGEFSSEPGGMDWEREVRGYNRQQVDNYVAWRAGQVRELESRLSQSLGEIEHLRDELADTRASAARPPHEEISERISQILKLAAEEAKAEREHGASDANDTRETARAEVDQLRTDAQQEVDRLKTDGQERAERMLTAAQEQADRAVATATAEAEQMVSSAHATAEKTVGEANEHAEKTVSTALAQAKQALDEATARATAIHDGAERRLNLLISRHTETMRRLTEIRDVVTGLVSGEVSRGSLEDEVNRALGLQQQAANGTQGAIADGRNGQAETAISGPQRVPRSLPAAEGRRGAHQAAPAELQADPQGAVRGGRSANGRDEDDPDPLTGPLPDPLNGPHPDPLTGPLPDRREGRYAGRNVSISKHATDAALQAAEELRQAAATGNGNRTGAQAES